VSSVPWRERQIGGDRSFATLPELHSCLSRVLRWRVPPNWSVSEWRNEIRAEAACAAWQAVSEYDPSRGVPFSAFARQRVLTHTLTRLRQEWAYALRCAQEQEPADSHNRESDSAPYTLFEDWPRGALARLSKPDLWLIGQLFLRGRTEAEIARKIGITQQGVNKRKWLILSNLRQLIGKESSLEGGVFSPDRLRAPDAIRHKKKRTQL
jgi:DNA-directed RNA polymerase specialized sigma24 family protein